MIIWVLPKISTALLAGIPGMGQGIFSVKSLTTCFDIHALVSDLLSFDAMLRWARSVRTYVRSKLSRYLQH